MTRRTKNNRHALVAAVLAAIGFSDAVAQSDNGYCDIGCGDAVCAAPCTPACRGAFYAGYEAVIVQPRYSSNEAFTVMTADGGSFETFSTREFDYDLEHAPRVYLGWRQVGSVGFRAAWWQFNHDPRALIASPPANGFGRIEHPAFGDVDISSTIPGDVFTASTNLNAYAIDLELTKSKSFSRWDLGFGCGFRYAQVEQSYHADLVNAVGTTRGSIDFLHKLDGYGPTVSVDAYRGVASDAGFFCKARMSALFGQGESRLLAREDLDLSSPFTTTRTARRDDLLPIGEVQVGFRWEGLPQRGQIWRPMLSAAMEGQVWHDAGNAASEDGSLGFYGFNVGAGLTF